MVMLHCKKKCFLKVALEFDNPFFKIISWSRVSMSTCTAVGLLLGSHWSMSFIKVIASLLAFGMRVFKWVGTH